MKKRSYDKHYGKILLDVEYIFGDKFYKYKGEIHRDDGQPAIVRESGTKQWFRDGKLHREDGPAVEHAGGRSYSYYLNDTLLSRKEEWEELLGLHKSI